MQCAAAAWNNATDGASPPNKIGYYLVVDQQNLTNIEVPDITVIKEDIEDLANCNVGHNNESANRQNVVRLDPVNGDLGVGAGLNFNASDLCGRAAHELGHLLGVGEVGNCKSVMFGTNLDGTRDVDTPQPNDVAQVNRNFNAATRTNCQEITPGGSAPEPVVTPTPCPDNDGDGYESSSCGGNDCDDNNWALNPADMDGDGFSTCTGDCNDYDSDANPAIQLNCDHETDWPPGTDRNCNGINDSEECLCPILIDVDGSGFQLSDANNGVWFDFFDTGSTFQLSWTVPQNTNAWLVLDRNGNGVVDNARELFGNITPQPTPPFGISRNGFLALAEYDKPENGGNRDESITVRDAVFSSLRLWRDANHNGISEASELRSLIQLGLSSIELGYKESKRTDQYGNRFRFRAKVKDVKGDHLGRWAWDVFLVRRP